MLSIDDSDVDYVVEARLPLPTIYTPYSHICGKVLTNLDAYNNKCLGCNKRITKKKVTDWIGTIPWRYWRPIYVKGNNEGIYPPSTD